DDGAVSLLVDEIGDGLEVPESLFERPPQTLDGAAREMVLGAYKLPERLLLILDTGRTVYLKAGGREAERTSEKQPIWEHINEYRSKAWANRQGIARQCGAARLPGVRQNHAR